MRSPRGVLELVTPPATEPVSRDEAKAHARIEVSADDDLIDAYIAAARQMVEQFTGRALITQTWKLTLDCWPGAKADDWWDGAREGAISMLEGSEIELCKAPFRAITSVNTYDESNNATLWASSNYYAAPQAGGFGRLVKVYGSTWPTLVRDKAAIAIAFTAGYGANASDVPMALRQAVKIMVAWWYENRDVKDIPQAATNLMRPYMVGR
jgi:hypothetical protein